MAEAGGGSGTGGHGAIGAGTMAAGGGAGSPTPAERAALKARRKAQPQFRNIRVDEILRYRMAPAAIVSILHRISGVLMFLVGIPFLLYLLQKSLTSELSFETYRAVATSGVGKLVLLVLIWGFFHHLLAGIRFLVLDLHIGTERQTATLTARIVLGLSILFTLISAGFLFGLF